MKYIVYVLYLKYFLNSEIDICILFEVYVLGVIKIWISLFLNC